MSEANNAILLRGTLAEKPVYSHSVREERFFRMLLSVRRLSGTEDLLPVLVRERLLRAAEPGAADMLCVQGELRSFNNRSGVGAKLVLSVFARELRFEEGEDDNRVSLSGLLCRLPNLRQTPLGREVCDLMLAVPRRTGRADYLPCICWGHLARKAALLSVGAALKLEGRLQSRVYLKQTEAGPERRTAYEVSVSEWERAVQE